METLVNLDTPWMRPPSAVRSVVRTGTDNLTWPYYTTQCRSRVNGVKQGPV